MERVGGRQRPPVIWLGACAPERTIEMPENEISDKGVYLDAATGKVVKSPPEEGVQLVGPGTLNAGVETSVEVDVEKSKTGVFVDAKTGKVVHSPPEEGVQLAAPGVPLTPNVKRDIETAVAAAGGVETAVSARPSKRASKPKAVTTADLSAPASATAVQPPSDAAAAGKDGDE